MLWTLDEKDPALPILANGPYGLSLTPEDIDALRAHDTIMALERGLFDLVGRYRMPRVGRDALRTAFDTDGRPRREQLDEIWGLLHPATGSVTREDEDADV